MLARVGDCDERAQLRTGRLDLPGAALAALGFGSLTYGMVEGADKGFGSYWWAFAVAGVALTAFVVVERRVATPMLPFELFRRRNFFVANIATFLVYASLYGFLIYFTLYLQFLGFSAFETGLINVPMSIVMILLAARFGALADRHGPRLYLTLGPCMLGVAALVMILVQDRADFWTIGIASILLFSFGLAILVAPITATALKAAPSEFAGIASGVNSTVSRLGSLMAVAVIGLVISLVFENRTNASDAVPLGKNQVGAELRDASEAGFRAAMLVVSGLAFAGAAVSAIGISNREARGGQEVSAPEPAPAES